MLLFHELAHNAYSHFQSSNQNGRKVKTKYNLTIPSRYINDLYCKFVCLSLHVILVYFYQVDNSQNKIKTLARIKILAPPLAHKPHHH